MFNIGFYKKRLLPLLALQLLFFLPLLLHTGLGDISFLVPALAGRGLPA